MKLSLAVFILVLAAISPHARATPAVCPEELATLPMPADSRIQPLLARAEDVLKSIFDRSSLGEFTATQAYCRLSLSALFPELAREIPLAIPVKREDTRSYLGLNRDQGGIDAAELAALMPKIAKDAETLAERYGETAAVKDLRSLVTKAALYVDITSGSDWKIPAVTPGPEGEASVRWRNVITLSGSPEGISRQALDLGRGYEDEFGTGQLLELKHRNLHLTRWGLLLAFLALARAFIANSARDKGLIALVAALFAVETAEAVLRVLISGHAPVANMYETVMGAGLIALGISFFLARFKNDKAPLMAGLLFNVISLFMLNFSGGMLDPRMRALSPALRDNFWLSTHVTAVTASYAAFALSWLIANAQLIKEIFSPAAERSAVRASELCYDGLKIGTVMLSSGIFLGALWADYSWGRFWGWDPKETWSLITLFTYIGILHGRMTRRMKPNSFLVAVAAAFLSVMMTWFGVNYVLATGLHSYGFSEGGSVFMAGVFASQILVITAHAVAKKLRGTGPSASGFEPEKRSYV